MTILESITFPTSAEYQADVSVLRPFSSIIAALEDVPSDAIYSGVRMEDETVGQIIIPWNSSEAFKSYIQSHAYKEDAFPKFVPSFDITKRDQIKAKLFSFSWPLDKVTAILTAPVTEFAFMEAKSVELAEETKTRIENLGKAGEDSSGLHGLTVGVSVDDETKFMILGGWDRVEDHDSATKKEKFLKARDALYEVECTLVEIFHVKALGVELA